MEEAVAEHLREEDFHAIAGQLFEVHAGRAQAVDLRHGMPCMRSITITLDEQ
jgi:hypothetical protein